MPDDSYYDRVRNNTLRNLYAQPDAASQPDQSSLGAKFDEGRDWLYNKVGNLVLGKPADLSKPAYTTPSVAAPGYSPPWGSPLNIGPTTPPAHHPAAAQTDAALQHMAETGVNTGLLLGGLGMGGPEGMTPRGMAAQAGIGTLQTLTPPRTDNVQQGIIAAGQPELPTEIAPTRAQQMEALLRGDVPDTGMTGAQVLKQAAAKKKLGYADWERQNPGAEEGMFDYQNAEPAPIGADRGQLPRYTPPRGIPARVQDAINNPEVEKAVMQAVQDGGKVLPENWYRTGPLYKTFEAILGPDKAPPAYERLMQFVAGTSPRSRVPDNLRTASYYYYLDKNNLPLPAKPAAGYGSVAQKLHLQNIANIQEQGGLNPLQNPKPASFSENLLGNESVLTSDTHNFRFIGMASQDPRFLANSAQIEVGQTAKGKPIYKSIKPRQMYANGQLTMEEALQNPTYWDSAPAKNEYKAVEDYQRGLAEKAGLPLADFQGKMWVGGGFPSETRSWHTGLGSPPESFLRTFAKRVNYTAARMKVSPEEVLHKFVTGGAPLLGLAAGAVGAGALTHPGQQPASSDQEDQWQ